MTQMANKVRHKKTRNFKKAQYISEDEHVPKLRPPSTKGQGSPDKRDGKKSKYHLGNNFFVKRSKKEMHGLTHS